MTLRERPRFERIAVSGHTGVRCSHTSSLDCANASAAVVGMSNSPAPSQKFTVIRSDRRLVRPGHPPGHWDVTLRTQRISTQHTDLSAAAGRYRGPGAGSLGRPSPRSTPSLFRLCTL